MILYRLIRRLALIECAFIGKLIPQIAAAVVVMVFSHLSVVPRVYLERDFVECVLGNVSWPLPNPRGETV